MTPEELKLMSNLQAQVDRIQGVVEKLIDKVAALEKANALQNFVNEVNSNTTTNDTK
tara:strand:- start:1477 stop:1647 length:171 start_codon:yes stop_codon:yes gene_type:complete